MIDEGRKSFTGKIEEILVQALCVKGESNVIMFLQISYTHGVKAMTY